MPSNAPVLRQPLRLLSLCLLRGDDAMLFFGGGRKHCTNQNVFSFYVTS
jgi:hypothetical protein